MRAALFYGSLVTAGRRTLFVPERKVALSLEGMKNKPGRNAIPETATTFGEKKTGPVAFYIT